MNTNINIFIANKCECQWSVGNECVSAMKAWEFVHSLDHSNFFFFFIYRRLLLLFVTFLMTNLARTFSSRESLQDRRYGKLYPSRSCTITCRIVRREAWETLGFSDVAGLAGPVRPRTQSTLPKSDWKCERGRQHPGKAGLRSRGTSADRHDNMRRGTHSKEQRPT